VSPLRHGLGVAQDYAEAARWYMQSRQTDPVAVPFAPACLAADDGAEDPAEKVAAALRAAWSSRQLPDFSRALASPLFLPLRISA
jgi:hypothetical protein